MVKKRISKKEEKILDEIDRVLAEIEERRLVSSIKEDSCLRAVRVGNLLYGPSGWGKTTWK